MRTIKINSKSNPNIFLVELYRDDVVVRTFNFWNFIGNGDKLTLMTSEWINFGTVFVPESGFERL